jgi:hypothetical protein
MFNSKLQTHTEIFHLFWWGASSRKTYWNCTTDRIKRDIAGIGCDARIVQNCESLPTQVEALVMKIYKYSHICMVSATELQRFSDEDGSEYKTVLWLGNTHLYFRRQEAFFEGMSLWKLISLITQNANSYSQFL